MGLIKKYQDIKIIGNICLIKSITIHGECTDAAEINGLC